MKHFLYSGIKRRVFPTGTVGYAARETLPFEPLSSLSSW
jgi:hypothetical protein